jgi:hypothetical protein
MKQVLLLIGTRKDGFLAVFAVSRRSWELQGPVFKGIEVKPHSLRLRVTAGDLSGGKERMVGSRSPNLAGLRPHLG